jgi:hypothetical protein
MKWDDLVERAREVDDELGMRYREGKVKAVEQAKAKEVVKAAGGAARRKSEAKKDRLVSLALPGVQQAMEGEMCSPMYSAPAISS